MNHSDIETQRTLSRRREPQRKPFGRSISAFSAPSLRSLRLFLFIFLLYTHSSFAAPLESFALQYGKINDSSDSLGFFENASTPSKSRTKLILYSTLGLYPISMYWLYTQWYKDYEQTSFHFFNDQSEWQGMDKCGHIWTAYTITKPLAKSFQWAGYSSKKSTRYAAGIALLYQTTIEVFDGFSSEWGFSVTDFVANTAGILTYSSQELFWKQQRIVIKFSFHESEYAQYRKSLLGEDIEERMLKDYNGQTYWLSVNPASFLSTNSKFPKWISLALGYGAEGMTGGKENLTDVDGTEIPEFPRYKQFYLGLDLDLARVDFHSRFLNSFFRVINLIRLPAPAIEFNSGKSTKFYWLYF